jgi:S1-C subfamily serine protease
MKRILVFCTFIFGLAFAGHAEPTAEQVSAVVRILAPHPPDKDGGILVGNGTGFVISNDGLIMTNNHVVASDMKVADHPYTYLVLQKIGDRVVVFRASFVAQDPNADLAVIRCEGIKATPFQFLTSPPKVLEEVYSLGFPQVADGAVSSADFAVTLDERLKEKGVTSLDITDEVQSDKLLKDLVVATAPSGKVERLTDVKWVNEVMPFIQHSCDIRGGNSGGPLLNGGGQVVGVVGDGYKSADGDHAGEKTKWALQTGQVEKFLQTNHITGCNFTAKAWTPPITKTYFVPIIVAASLAIAVALTALLMTLLKASRKTGMTALLGSLKSKGVTSGTKLLEYIGGRPGQQSSPSGPSIVPGPQGNGWKLDVRTSAGKTFRIPITEAMFTNNGSRLVLGRSDELCDLVVEDETVSRQHADIRKNGKGFEVADRNSSNGTAVNGVFIRKPFQLIPLKPGDTLTVGNVKLDFDRN